MTNPTIGYVTCPICGDQAEVRRYKTGKKLLYYVGEAGKITPNYHAGQKWLESAMTPLTESSGEPAMQSTESNPESLPEKRSLLDSIFGTDGDSNDEW